MPKSEDWSLEAQAAGYVPHPFRPEGASGLPADLLPLLEELSRNAHDEWALMRLQGGWRWGPERDDVANTHPCLVPYMSLPEGEKDHDRAAVITTLQLILRDFEIRRRRRAP